MVASRHPWRLDFLAAAIKRSISAVVRYSRVRTEEFTVVGADRPPLRFSTIFCPRSKITRELSSVSSLVSIGVVIDPDTTPFRHLFCFVLPAVAQSPQDRPPDAAAATNADTVAFRSTSNSSAMIVSIPARARMRPAHQLARAQHQLAGRDVGAPDPLLNSAAVERRLRRAVQRGKITGTGHILGCVQHQLADVKDRRDDAEGHLKAGAVMQSA